MLRREIPTMHYAIVLAECDAVAGLALLLANHGMSAPPPIEALAAQYGRRTLFSERAVLEPVRRRRLDWLAVGADD